MCEEPAMHNAINRSMAVDTWDSSALLPWHERRHPVSIAFCSTHWPSRRNDLRVLFFIQCSITLRLQKYRFVIIAVCKCVSVTVSYSMKSGVGDRWNPGTGVPTGPAQKAEQRYIRSMVGWQFSFSNFLVFFFSSFFFFALSIWGEPGRAATPYISYVGCHHLRKIRTCVFCHWPCCLVALRDTSYVPISYFPYLA